MPTHAIAPYRRYWGPEIVALGLAGLAVLALFAWTGADIAAQRPFHHPELANPWPVAESPLWSLLYRSAPWVTGSLAVLGAGLLVAGLIGGRWPRARLYGALILLSVMLGPGLVVNAVLKDHWGRPRPRQIAEFGGQLEYVLPFQKTSLTAKSFPCGHCSVGYLYGIGWWIWRRRRPRWAAASLATGVTLGTLLGLGRMAAGAHFLSDALWSALIVYAVTHCLYYHVLRIPAREDAPAADAALALAGRPQRRRLIVLAVVVAIGIVGAGMLASPHDRDLGSSIAFGACAARPRALEVTADALDVEITLTGASGDAVSTAGSIQGFGLPTNRIEATWSCASTPPPALAWRLETRGFFTDLDGSLRLAVPATRIERIVVRLGQGNITVIDARAGKAAASLAPSLDLRTGSGRIVQP